MTESPDHGALHLLKGLAPQVLGAMVRRYRNFAAAEDAVQEALIAAALQWPAEGVPDNPRGWLYQVARRRMIDFIRNEAARRAREDAIGATMPDSIETVTPDEPGPHLDPDDTLILLFMCCHPSLTQSSAIALTLRAVGGLTTAEIASAFLVPEATIGQRISRAKEAIRASNIPFQAPDAAERSQRLGAVLHVLYLIFSEGYTTSTGTALHRVDLSNEAIRLARELRALLPGSGDTTALLALMLLTDARRAARTGPNGELVPLDEQDRSRWNRAQIAEGVALAETALAMGAIGEYQVQAAIAAVHDEAARAEDTDWPQILTLYEMLLRINESPVVALNHAIATAMVQGPAAGLALLAELEGDKRLGSNHRLDAVRAHLLERAGDRQAAIKLYQAVAKQTSSEPERHYLIMKAAQLRERATPGNVG